MAILNRGVVDAMNKTYSTIYNEARLEAKPPVFESQGVIYEITGVNSAQLDLAWMRSYVRMREWVGEREVHDAELFSHLMYNTKFEGTVRTEITDIEDGIYRLKATTALQDLADAYTIRKSAEYYALLERAFTDTNTLDGVPLFSANHPYGRLEFDDSRPRGQKWVFNQDGTFSNFTTAQLTEDALWAARRNFQGFVNHMGEPAQAMPNLLVVGPQNERNARNILVKGTKADGSENETQGLFTYVVEPRITDGKWFLFDTTKRRKPFVFWNRVAPQLQRMNGDSMAADAAEGAVSQYVFNNDAVLHGVRARMGFGYGLPELAYGSDASAA